MAIKYHSLETEDGVNRFPSFPFLAIFQGNQENQNILAIFWSKKGYNWCGNVITSNWNSFPAGKSLEELSLDKWKIVRDPIELENVW